MVHNKILNEESRIQPIHSVIPVLKHAHTSKFENKFQIVESDSL